MEIRNWGKNWEINSHNYVVYFYSVAETGFHNRVCHVLQQGRMYFQTLVDKERLCISICACT